jgi:hypothetical protein
VEVIKLSGMVDGIGFTDPQAIVSAGTEFLYLDVNDWQGNKVWIGMSPEDAVALAINILKTAHDIMTTAETLEAK